MTDPMPTQQPEQELPISLDYFTEPQKQILRAMDNKNLDTTGLEQMFLDALAKYEAVSDGVADAGTASTANPATG